MNEKIEKPEISEKLIDKLLEEEKEICHHCRAWNVFIKGCDGWQENCRPRMKAMVTSLLSAVRNGEVKIPGEARRTWLDEFEGYCEEEYGTHRVIILFPEDLARYNEEAGKKRREPEQE